jgi:hypothetical protein
VALPNATATAGEQALWRICPLKMQCRSKESSRKLIRSIHEEARDVARAIARTSAFGQSCCDRKRIEMLFAQPRVWFLTRRAATGFMRRRATVRAVVLKYCVAERLKRSPCARRIEKSRIAAQSWKA